MGRYLQLGDSIFYSPLDLAKYIARGLRKKESDKDIDEYLDSLTEDPGYFQTMDIKDLLKRNDEYYDICRDNWELMKADQICDEIMDQFWGFDDDTKDGDYIVIYGYDLLVVEEPTEEDEEAFEESLDKEMVI